MSKIEETINSRDEPKMLPKNVLFDIFSGIHNNDKTHIDSFDAVVINYRQVTIAYFNKDNCSNDKCSYVIDIDCEYKNYIHLIWAL